MHTLWQDVRYGLRMLAKNPGFTAVAVLTLALGIGANTAVFSTANTFLFKPLSFPEMSRLVMVMNQAPDRGFDWNSVSPADFLDWKEQSRSFEAVGAYEWNSVNLTGTGEPLKAQGFRVSASFFDILREPPLMGRAFRAGEDEPGQDAEVILSYGLWSRQFGADPAIVGKTVRLDGRSYTIIGVMREELNFPAGAQLWTPLALDADERRTRNSHYLSPLARLKQGVSLAQAQAEMRAIQERLQTAFPKTETGWNVRVIGLGPFVTWIGRQYEMLLLGVVGFVLLIACANVANLLLAHNSARQKEFAIRAAIGAGRGHLVRQLLVESVLLGLAGAGVGLLLGAWGIDLIQRNMPPEVARYIPGWKHVRLDLGVFAYTLTVALAGGIIAGLAPAFQNSRLNVNENLKESGRGSTGSQSTTRMRNAFVVAEVTLSLVLLIGAVLMSKGVGALFALNFHFDPQTVLTMQVNLPETKYKTPSQQADFFGRVLERLRSIPGVETAAVAGDVPFGVGGYTSGFSIENRPVEPNEYRVAQRQSVSPEFFRLLHVLLREGRELKENDGADSPRVAVVSEEFARRYWPGQSALGRQIKTGGEESKAPWTTIVGVVEEVKYDPFLRAPLPTIYSPVQQSPQSGMYIAVRTTGAPGAIFPALRAAISSVDPDQPVYDVLPLDRVIANQILGLSYVAVMMGVAGLMALLLSAVGVYGVMAYSVTQRLHEIGVRMALGARPKDVLRLFVVKGLALTGIGVLIGLPAGYGLARVLSSLLYGVSADDLASFAAGTLVLAAAAFAACYIPARRATHVDPIVALRHE